MTETLKQVFDFEIFDKEKENSKKLHLFGKTSIFAEIFAGVFKDFHFDSSQTQKPIPNLSIFHVLAVVFFYESVIFIILRNSFQLIFCLLGILNR